MSAEDVRTTTVGERQPEVQEKSVRSDANQPEAQDTLRIRAEDGDAISPMDSAREAAAQLNREVQQGHRTEGFLQANDDAGGHTLDRHVGKTDDHLLERASQAKRGEASSFEGTPAEPRIAEAAIADVLRTRSADIQDWLSGQPTRDQQFTSPVEGTVGRVADAEGNVRPSSEVRAVLRPYEDSYTIHTAYVL